MGIVQKKKGQEATARKYGERALEMLRQAVGKGYANAPDLENGAAFEALRKEMDMKKELDKLAAAAKLNPPPKK
jgi:hypothetical protein